MAHTLAHYAFQAHTVVTSDLHVGDVLHGRVDVRSCRTLRMCTHIVRNRLQCAGVTYKRPYGTAWSHLVAACEQLLTLEELSHMYDKLVPGDTHATYTQMYQEVAHYVAKWD